MGSRVVDSLATRTAAILPLWPDRPGTQPVVDEMGLGRRVVGRASGRGSYQDKALIYILMDSSKNTVEALHMTWYDRELMFGLVTSYLGRG